MNSQRYHHKVIGLVVVFWLQSNMLLEASVAFSPADFSAMANGRGRETYNFEGKNVGIADFYNTAQLCKTECNATRPCAKNNAYLDGPNCLTPSSFQDYSADVPTTNYFCRSGYVCCNTALCRPRVLKCTFNFAAVKSALDKLPIPKSVQVYADGTSNSMPSNFLDMSISTERRINDCNDACNSWSTSIDDIQRDDCPKSCECQEIQQANFVAQGDWICSRSQKHPTTGVVYNAYMLGSTSPYAPDSKLVCPKNSTCANSDKCIDYERYMALKTAVSSYNNEQSAGSKKLQPGYIALIVIVSIIAIVLLAVIVFLILKRHQSQEKNQQPVTVTELEEESDATYRRL